MGLITEMVHRAMALDLSTKDVKVRVAKLFNLSEDEAGKLILRAKMERNKPRVRAGRKKMVFLPQCLRKRDCKAPLTEEGFQCKRCNPDCQARAIRDCVLAAGASCYIVPGGTMLRNLVAKNKPDGVIGVACWKEVEEGLDECDKAGVPAVGVVLVRDGCVDTLVDVEEVKALLDEVGLSSKPVKNSSSSQNQSKS